MLGKQEAEEVTLALTELRTLLWGIPSPQILIVVIRVGNLILKNFTCLPNLFEIGQEAQYLF